MHTSIERRTPSSTRMPVTMSVELAHDGWEETYEADAVNVSGSGIGVRGPVLPDVGQRMRCRFNLAELGAEFGTELSASCETEGEVMWASDAGHAGEFGIRFDTLEPRVGEALARWVSTLESAPSTASELAQPSAPRRQVRVQLDGVASPIEAEIAVTEGNRVRVEQALPFLLLGTHATVDAAGLSSMRRVLRSVELKIEGSVPKLVLELEPCVEASLAEGADDADADDAGPATVADAPLEELLEAASHRAVEAAHSVPSKAIAPVIRHTREDDSPRSVRLMERDALAELGVDAPGDPEEGLPFADRLREVGDKVKPSLQRISVSMKAAWAAALASTGPRLGALGIWLRNLARAAQNQIATRAPQILARLKREPARRRTTVAPEAEARPSRKKGAELVPEIEAKARPRLPLRLVLLGGLVLAAVMFVVRALSAPAEEAALVHEPTLELGAETDGAAIEAPAPATVVAAVSEPVSAVDVPEVPAPVLPGTLSAASSEAGRLAAPTYPRVSEGASAPEPTEVEESLSIPSGSTSFGAVDVPHGRATTLTMSLPITSIEGEATDSGFTVNLPGVNSLSRAAPIAAANPSVERAAILNSGDHAVLTVRFVAGRNPAYRVEARGSDLVITIGR